MTIPDPAATQSGSRLAVVVADAVASAVGAALSTVATPAEDRGRARIVVPRGPSDELLAAAVRAVRARDRASGMPEGTAVLRSPGRVGALAALARESWTSVPLGAGAERFDQARLPSELLRSNLTVVTLLPPLGTDIERPVALLARFADPRQIAAAQLHDFDAGAFAELASPLPTSLLLLVGRVGGYIVAAATRDLLAAELAWEAFRELARDTAGPVAWQAPVVQRLAQLDPRARHPDELDLEVRSLDRACEQVAGKLRSWLEMRLGIPESLARGKTVPSTSAAG